MPKQFIRFIDDHARLFFNPRTGIATVEDGKTGTEHSPHPSIDSTGSPGGMVRRGLWEATDQIVLSNGAYYNISRCSIRHAYDAAAAAACCCGGNHEGKGKRW